MLASVIRAAMNWAIIITGRFSRTIPKVSDFHNEWGGISETWL
jgi:hypothetical protein